MMDTRTMKLEDFNISRNTGFLLDTPLTVLPDKFKAWEEIAGQLPELIESKRLREKVLAMEVIDHTILTSYREKRLAHLQLTSIASGYIWQDGDSGILKNLPASVSIPWCALSEELGLKPSVCHAAIVLVNWKLKHPEKPFSLDNLDHLCPFPGGDSAKWFCLITVQMEKLFTSALISIETGIQAMCTKDDDILVKALENIRQVIQSLKKTFSQMHERVVPEDFYFKLRPFLAGWGGATSPLQDGLIYSGVSNKPKKLSGGSAAQSSIFQTLDAFLGVEHTEGQREFLREMRNYMPPSHRQFIEFLEARPLRQYVLENPNNALQLAYQRCLDTLIDFRSYHLQIVTKYVVVMSHRKTQEELEYKAVSKQGTGGSSLIPFLKAVRRTTEQAQLVLSEDSSSHS